MSCLLPLFLNYFLLEYSCFPGDLVQFSHTAVSDSATLGTAACQTSLSMTNSWRLLKLMSI